MIGTSRLATLTDATLNDPLFYLLAFWFYALTFFLVFSIRQTSAKTFWRNHHFEHIVLTECMDYKKKRKDLWRGYWWRQFQGNCSKNLKKLCREIRWLPKKRRARTHGAKSLNLAVFSTQDNHFSTAWPPYGEFCMPVQRCYGRSDHVLTLGYNIIGYQPHSIPNDPQDISIYIYIYV